MGADALHADPCEETATRDAEQDVQLRLLLPKGFAERLGSWQSTFGRHDLPWQASKDPYLVWLSEIMLQQTQVVTAAGFYARFLDRFPDVHALAAASEEAVMASWSGLGYYSRARNLHACARTVVEDHDGFFPVGFVELQELPGIGPSTAAAVASICHGERVSIFDGNVQRVLARLSAFEGDLAKLANKRRLQALAKAALPEMSSDMPRHTQALMDLGATVCVPKNPGCGQCPFQSDCRSRQVGIENRVPLVIKAKKKRLVNIHWLCLWDRDSLWVVQRPRKGIWAGLWTPPECDTDAPDAWLEKWGLDRHATHQPTFKHALTHMDLRISAVHLNAVHVNADMAGDPSGPLFAWLRGMAPSLYAHVAGDPVTREGEANTAGCWVRRSIDATRDSGSATRDVSDLGMPKPVQIALQFQP